MSVIENIDIVMGARTEQMDAAIAKELKNMEQLKASIGSMSATGAAFSPVAAQIASAVSAYSTGLPGVAAAAGIFASSAAAIRAAYAKKNDDVEKLAAAMAKLKARATEAKREVHDVAKPTAMMDPRGANVTAALSGGSMLGDLMLGKQGPFSGRSAAEQKAYEASIDSALAKTATYKSTWTATGQAMSGATGLGVVGVGALATGVGLAVAGMAGLAHVSGEVAKQMKEIDDTSDAAKKLGMTFKDLETVRFTNQFAGGMDAASTDAAMQKMMVNLSEAAATGSGPVRDKLAAIGLDAGKLLEKGPVEALKQISAKTSELKSPNDQLLIAYELFGKAGTAMVETLRQGPGEIEKMEKKIQDMGLALSQSQVEQVGASNDAWDEVTMAATGAYRQIAAEVAPALQMIAENVLGITGTFGGMGETVSMVVTGVTYFAGTMHDIYEVVTLTQKVMTDIANLDFTQAGKDIEAAYTFDGGAKAVERLNKIREEAANKAKNPTQGDDSVVVGAEAAKKAIEEQQKLQAQAAEESRKAAEAKSKKYDEIGLGIQRETEALQRANELRMQGLKVNEADLKLIQEANSITSGTGGIYIEKLLQQKNAQEQIKRDIEEADRLKKDSLTSDERALERARELQRLKQAGRIDDKTFNAAMLKNAKDTMQATPEYRGAASAQAGSVEAYKLLLERDKTAINEAMKQTALQERAADILQQIQNEMKSGAILRTI